jgi:quercetin dioxygenase-like cupin family protein
MTSIPGKIINQNELDPVLWMGEQGRFLLRADDTGGLFSFFQITTSPGGGPPLHLHEDHDEALYVLEGEYEIRLGERVVSGVPGTIAFSPRGTPHRFRGVAKQPSRGLVIASPGGHERFFEELSGLLSNGHPVPEDFVTLATKHHIRGLEPLRPIP